MLKMIKAVVRYIVSRTSANAFAIINVLVDSLDPVHKAKLVVMLTGVKAASNVVESMADTVLDAAKD